MATLTPSGISRSSSEWLLPNRQSNSVRCEHLRRSTLSPAPESWAQEVCGVIREGERAMRSESVHVLHFEDGVGEGWMLLSLMVVLKLKFASVGAGRKNR